VKPETRLAGILFLLKANKSQTAEELAQALKVTVRTIYRDVESLVEAGLPIRGTQGPSGGYVLAEYFPVDPFVFSRNEVLSLISTPSEQRSDKQGTNAGQAIDAALKLLAEGLPEISRALVTRLRERFLFDTANWFWRDAPLRQYPELKEAILNDLTVEIIYTERGEPSVKTGIFDPYGMVWRQGHWYALVFSHTTKRYERHRLQRIVSVRLTGKRFSREDSFDLPACWSRLLEDFGKGQILVRIKIDYPATLDFETFGWKKDQRITKHDDHWIVEMPVDKYEWLIPLVLSYGGKVQVLEPASVRKEIAERLEVMTRQYAAASGRPGTNPKTE
jgi:predicted DNA-binding transcriptional regulator YafY